MNGNPPQLKLKGNTKRSATWLELFFDLVFVIAIGGLAHRIEHPNGIKDILMFITFFIPVWWAWVGHTVYSTRFDTYDISHRLFSILIMLAAIIMRISLQDDLQQSMRVFAIGYILARCSLIGLYIRAGLYERRAKKMVLLYVVGFGAGVTFWITSLFLSYPLVYYFWWIGIAIDLAVPWLGRKKILSQYPLDTSHLPERFGLFTIIVLGEILVGVVSGLSITGWNFIHICIGILLFCISVSIWWAYFGYLHRTDHSRHLGSGQPFIYAHLPLVMGITILGGTSKTILLTVMKGEFLYILLPQLFFGVAFFALSFLLIVRISYVNARSIYWIYFIYFSFFMPLLFLADSEHFNKIIMLSATATIVFFVVISISLQKMINLTVIENVT